MRTVQSQMISSKYKYRYMHLSQIDIYTEKVATIPCGGMQSD